ncbi:MAG: WGR domain-containing protein [Planctomycetota bacterium]|nr:WGR domain-containing protein [Planctomycetota bacterium]
MSSETPNKSITLYFRQNNSDKVYQAGIEPKGTGFVVNFAFGRRGSTFQTGTKTAKPVDYQTAVTLFEKLINEKMAKGYTPGQDGTPYQGTDREDLATGVFPQLLNPIGQDQAEQLIRDDGWWMQEKFDGKRILIRKDGDQVIGINRKGLAVALPQPVAQQALTIGSRQWLMDGEAIGDLYFAFDLLEQDGMDLRKEPYSRRLDALSVIVVPGGKGAIRVNGTATGTAQKKNMLAALCRLKAEGVVFKRHAAPYTPGRPSTGGDQLKWKFTATASCIVAKANGTKRSVALALLEGGKRVAVGNVTVPANQQIPKAGSTIEVRYLYAYPGGSLFQPVYLGVRDDVDPAACTIGQLKWKARGEDEESESGTGGQHP